MKFFLRLLKHLAILFLISIPLEILGMIILISVVPFRNIGSLPYLLRWFDGADYYVGRDTSVVDKINAGIHTDYSFFSGSDLPLWKIIINKYVWLAWRNPCNYFGYKYLGAKIKVPVKSERIWSRIPETGYEIGNTTYDIPGSFYQEFVSEGKTYYEYYYIKHYNLFGKSLCIRFRMGWKIGQELGMSDKWCQGVCAIQPWMGYWGRNI